MFYLFLRKKQFFFSIFICWLKTISELERSYAKNTFFNGLIIVFSQQGKPFIYSHLRMYWCISDFTRGRSKCAGLCWEHEITHVIEMNRCSFLSFIGHDVSLQLQHRSDAKVGPRCNTTVLCTAQIERVYWECVTVNKALGLSKYVVVAQHELMLQ